MNLYHKKIKDITVEVGDSKQDAFYPQVKIKKWNNEVNYSLRLIHSKKDSVINNSDKISWKGSKIEANFYDKENAYEFEVVLKEKPESNIIQFTIQSKGLKFYYQRPLTKKEIEDGMFAPEEAISSYAIYSNKKDGKYGTGKVGHIYRPEIIDANGNKFWGKLNIENNILSITIPQDFLDNAVYPVIVDPTLGYTTVGTYSLPTASSFYDRRLGSYYTATANGTLDSIVAYTAGSANFDMKAFVNQKDSVASGSHGQIATVTNTGNASAAGWKTFTAGGESLISGNTYILNVLGKKDASVTSRVYYDVVEFDGSNTTFYYDYNSSGQYPSPESPWTQALWDTASSVSVWALSTNYSVDGSDGDSQVVKSGDWPKKTYGCILNHTSDADNEPGVGVNWETYWTDMGNYIFPKLSIYINYTEASSGRASASGRQSASSRSLATNRSNSSGRVNV